MKFPGKRGILKPQNFPEIFCPDFPGGNTSVNSSHGQTDGAAPASAAVDSDFISIRGKTNDFQFSFCLFPTGRSVWWLKTQLLVQEVLGSISGPAKSDTVNGSLSLQCFYGAVLPRHHATEMGPAALCMLRRIIASIMGI